MLAATLRKRPPTFIVNSSQVDFEKPSLAFDYEESRESSSEEGDFLDSDVSVHCSFLDSEISLPHFSGQLGYNRRIEESPLPQTHLKAGSVQERRQESFNKRDDTRFESVCVNTPIEVLLGQLKQLYKDNQDYIRQKTKSIFKSTHKNYKVKGATVIRRETSPTYLK